MLTLRISNSNPSYVEAIPKYTSRYEKQDPPVDLMEVFQSLDDDTVHRVFKMGALSERELRDIAKNSKGQKHIQPPMSPSPPQLNLDPEASTPVLPPCEAGRDSWMCKASAEVD
jgi:hypothetical protein